jgi:hypothetical protein
MALIFNIDPENKDINFPPQSLRDAVAIGTNQWTDGANSNELITALTQDQVTESFKYVNRTFKAGNYWFRYDFGSPDSNGDLHLVWQRGFLKGAVTGSTGTGNSFGLDDAVNDSTTTAITPHAVKVSTVQLTTDQTVAGIKKFTSPVWAPALYSADGRTKVNVANNSLGVEVVSPANLTNLRLSNADSTKGFVIRYEGRTGLGGDNENLQLNPLNNSLGSFHFMDPNAFQHSDTATFFATSPKLTLVRQGNMGVNTDNPTEKLEVVGVVKATSFKGDGSGITNPVKTGSVINFTSNAEYMPVSTGTFSIDTTNKVIGSVVYAYLNSGTTQPTLPTNVFQNTGSQDWVTGRNLMYGFKVGANGFIQFTITLL